MPTMQDHLNKARHNENYYQSFNLGNTLYLDWVVNGIFYSAMHYLDAYLATRTIHPSKHVERIRYINQDSSLGRRFYIKYRPLEQHSRAGRYDMAVFTVIQVRQDIIPLLSSVKQHLQQNCNLQIP